MRWTVKAVLAGAVGVTAVILGTSCAQQTSRQTTAATAAEDPLTRGRYLAVVLGCGDCHTPGYFFGGPDTTRTFAGSEMGWTGPWGTTYARNITPDVETGIGTWSEADIENALRTGQRPDKSPILPPMPWPSTAALNDADMQALIAYLKSIPAVSHAVPAVVPPGGKVENTVVFPSVPPAWDVRHLPPAAAPQ